MTDANSERFFYFRLVGRCRRDAGVLEHSVARVEYDWHRSDLALSAKRTHDGGGCRTISVIGNQQRVGGMSIIPCCQIEFAREMSIWPGLRLAVHAHDLL